MSEKLTVYKFDQPNSCLNDYDLYRRCQPIGFIKATIDDIAEAGWPICPDCGEDLERISE